MTLSRATSLGLVLTFFMTIVGCGDGASAPTAEENKPDAGLDASKKIMQMQPPAPTKKKSSRG